MAPKTRKDSMKLISQNKPSMISSPFRKNAIQGAERGSDVTAVLFAGVQQQSAAAAQEIASLHLQIGQRFTGATNEMKEKHARVRLLVEYVANVRELATLAQFVRDRAAQVCTKMLKQGPGIWEDAQSSYDEGKSLHDKGKLLYDEANSMHHICNADNLASYEALAQALGSLEEQLSDENVRALIEDIPMALQAIQKIFNGYPAYHDEKATSAAAYEEYHLVKHFLTELHGVEEQLSSPDDIYQHLITCGVKCNDEEVIRHVAQDIFSEWEEKLAADNEAPDENSEG